MNVEMELLNFYRDGHLETRKEEDGSISAWITNIFFDDFCNIIDESFFDEGGNQITIKKPDGDINAAEMVFLNDGNILVVYNLGFLLTNNFVIFKAISSHFL